MNIPRQEELAHTECILRSTRVSCELSETAFLSHLLLTQAPNAAQHLAKPGDFPARAVTLAVTARKLSREGGIVCLYGPVCGERGGAVRARGATTLARARVLLGRVSWRACPCQVPLAQKAEWIKGNLAPLAAGPLEIVGVGEVRLHMG